MNNLENYFSAMRCVLPPAYFGPISYFMHFATDQEIQIDVHSHFEKQSVRSRANILGANGKIKLIVPLAKWGNRTLMKDVLIDHSSNWQNVHLRSITAAYGNSPYFEHYAHHLQEFYSQKFEKLIDLDAASTQLLIDLIRLPSSFSNSATFIPKDTGAIVDHRSAFGRKPEAGTSIYQPYLQVFTDRFPFMANLSILDLLFNLGPESATYLIGIFNNSNNSN
jgi:hypothetical protein